MSVRLVSVVFDALDFRAQARFWSDALGWPLATEYLEHDEEVLQAGDGSELEVIFVSVRGRVAIGAVEKGGQELGGDVAGRVEYDPAVHDLLAGDEIFGSQLELAQGGLTSYAAPRWFGSRCADFEADLRRLLYEHSPDGLFWDWPGDTELVIATKT